MLLLVGAKDDGKSRLQHFIITPALGGRSANPAEWLLGDGGFNSECFGAEHLLMEDTPASQKRDERQRFKQRLKGVAVNDEHRYHEKGRPAVTLRPIWRLSMSLNDSPDDLAMLPPPSSDWTEKSLMLSTARPSYLPGTNEERARWRKALADEMPAFLHYLLNEYEIPPEYAGHRFGVMSYESPKIRQQLEDASPAAEVWDCIETLAPWKTFGGGGGNFFKGKLHEIETMLVDAPGVGDSLSRLLKKHALSFLLRSLANEKPSRITRSRSGDSGRFWLLWRDLSKPAQPAQPETDSDDEI